MKATISPTGADFGKKTIVLKFGAGLQVLGSAPQRYQRLVQKRREVVPKRPPSGIWEAVGSKRTAGRALEGLRQVRHTDLPIESVRGGDRVLH